MDKDCKDSMDALNQKLVPYLLVPLAPDNVALN